MASAETHSKPFRYASDTRPGAYVDLLAEWDGQGYRFCSSHCHQYAREAPTDTTIMVRNRNFKNQCGWCGAALGRK